MISALAVLPLPIVAGLLASPSSAALKCGILSTRSVRRKAAMFKSQYGKRAMAPDGWRVIPSNESCSQPSY